MSEHRPKIYPYGDLGLHINYFNIISEATANVTQTILLRYDYFLRSICCCAEYGTA
jgi:hypothetical protein